MFFSRKALVELTRAARPPVASIYLPTLVTGDTEQNRIMFKNLLRQAEDKLVAEGLRVPEARELLAPGEGLLNNNDFWQHQSNGLAAFFSRGLFRSYRVPLDLKGTVMTGKRCYVKPLLTLLHGDGTFYVLALSQNQARFLQCTRDSQRQVPVEGMPVSLAEVLRYDEPEKQQQMHTTGPGPAVFHGQGVAEDYDKDGILRYFQQVHSGLHPILKDEKAPLVLAAVDYLQAIFRQAGNYRGLVEPGIAGNPDLMADADLRRQAWKIIEPLYGKAVMDALDRYGLAATRGLGIGDVRDAVLAGYDRNIETLIIAKDLRQWGIFREDSHEVELADETAPDAQDLVELASVFTLIEDGEVFAIAAGEIPGGTPVAGIRRYKEAA